MKTHNDTFCPVYRATVLPNEDDNCSLCNARIVPISQSAEYIDTEGEAQDLAIDWQAWLQEASLSYGELAEWQDLFTDLGSKFNLTDEFRENGII